MCCSDPPPAPDLGPAAEASMEVARIAQQTASEQLDWAREQDALNRETLNQVLDVQLPAMREQAQSAREDRERWETMFRPMEDQFVQEAQEYDSPERQAAERGKAIADVSTQFDAARRNALQRLESYGVDPSQVRNSALDIGVRTAQAAQAAGAATQAGVRVEETGRNLRGQAIQLGRGIAGGVGAQYAGAVGAGQAAVQGGLATTGMGGQTMGGPGQWSGQALAGYGQGANIQSQGFQNQMTGWNAQQQAQAGMLQGVGNIIGGVAAIADGGEIRNGRAIDPNVIEGEYEDLGTVDTGRGDGSGIDDNVPALLSDGEYVIPADVVRSKGEEFFDKLLEKYHEPAAQQRQRAA